MTTAQHERNHPVTTATRHVVTAEDATKARKAVRELETVERLVTRVLVILGIGGLIFTAVNVTLFAVGHHVSPWIAWMLDPLVSVSLLAALFIDGKLAAHGYKPGGWPFVLRWFAGLSTWLMNCWGSLYPDGAFTGWPHHADPAGLLLHSVIPFLVIILSEAGSGYRKFSTRKKAAALATVAAWTDQAEAERQRREQQERQDREQAEQRREQVEREQREQAERERREQQDRADARAREQADREHALELARIAAQERQAEAERAERLRREQQERADKAREQARIEEQQNREREARERAAEERRQKRVNSRRKPSEPVHEQSEVPARKQPGTAPTVVREHRPLHAVNTPEDQAVNTGQMPEAEAVEKIRAAVDSGEVHVRGLARETGWSAGWVSKKVAELREPAEASA